jgi:hypothetical protein
MKANDAMENQTLTKFYLGSLLSLCLLNLIFLGFVLAWLLIVQQTQPNRRPGINIKDL